MIRGCKSMKKIYSLFLVLFLIHAGIIIQPITSSENTDQDGRLSGKILDPWNEPVSDAMITIACGQNTFVCYSNESGYYLQENIPIVFCLWNITISKQGYYNSYCDMPIGENSYCNVTLVPEPIVSLEIDIIAGFSFPSPTIIIRNKGTVEIHSVKIADIAIEGNVIYNNRETPVDTVLEPNDVAITSLNTWLIGLGSFSIVVTISCDEGSFSSDEINGLIFGPFIFIP